MAHATNPVGPSAVGQGETPVVATASAPYATAGAETGDTTNVVSASYVKGAYNDTIAAVNKVNADKQGKLKNITTNNEISTNVLSGNTFGTIGYAAIHGGDEDTAMREDVEREFDINLYDTLVSAGTVLDMLNIVGVTLENSTDPIYTELVNKRVRAVTAWGDDSTTSLIQFANAQ